MKLYHIVAMSNNRVIGKDNRLPWHFPADLKYFKQRTMESTVIMGRKTFESIGKPLAGRENFVLTKNPAQSQAHLCYFDTLEKALAAVTTGHAYIIGGESLYCQTIRHVDGIYQTLINASYEGDAFYPEIPDSFCEKSRETIQEQPRIDLVYYENKVRYIHAK